MKPNHYLWPVLLPLAALATMVTCIAVWGDEMPKIPTFTDPMPTFTDLAPKGAHIECDVFPSGTKLTGGPCRTVPDTAPPRLRTRVTSAQTPDGIVVPSIPEPGCYIARVAPSMAVEFLKKIPCEGAY